MITFPLIINICILIAHAYLVWGTVWVHHKTSKKLKDIGTMLKNDKIIPLLIWEDGTTTTCPPKDIHSFKVGETYEVEVSKKTFANPLDFIK